MTGAGLLMQMSGLPRLALEFTGDAESWADAFEIPRLTQFAVNGFVIAAGA